MTGGVVQVAPVGMTHSWRRGHHDIRERLMLLAWSRICDLQDYLLMSSGTQVACS